MNRRDKIQGQILEAGYFSSKNSRILIFYMIVFLKQSIINYINYDRE